MEFNIFLQVNLYLYLHRHIFVHNDRFTLKLCIMNIDRELALLEEQNNRGRSISISSSSDPMDSYRFYEDRFKKKPWLERVRGARKNAGWISRVLQFISAALGFYGAKVMMEFLPIPIPYIEYIMAAIFLYALEVAKRKFSDRFWDSYFAWQKGLSESIRWSAGLANIGLFSISLFLSAGGVYFMSGDFGAQAKLMGSGSDPEAQALIAERNVLRADIKEHRANKNSAGEIYWPSQTAIKNLTEQIAVINKTLKNKHGIYDIQNESIAKEWNIRSAFSKWSSVGFTIICEIFFESIMAFCSLYDVRMFIYLRLLEQQGGNRKKRGKGKLHALSA